jgi:hypothetical protein
MSYYDLKFWSNCERENAIADGNLIGIDWYGYHLQLEKKIPIFFCRFYVVGLSKVILVEKIFLRKRKFLASQN